MRHVAISIALLSTAGCVRESAERLGPPPAPPLEGADLENRFSIRVSESARGPALELDDGSIAEPTNALSAGLRIQLDATGEATSFMAKWTNEAPSFVFGSGKVARGYANVEVLACGDGCDWRCSTLIGPIDAGVATTVGFSLNYMTGVCRIYVDGAEQSSVADPSAPLPQWRDGSAPWTAGGPRMGLGRGLVGVIDDVWIDTSSAWSAASFSAWSNRRGSAAFPRGVSPATICRGGDDDAGEGNGCADYSGNSNDWKLGDSAEFAPSVHRRVRPFLARSQRKIRQTFAWLGQSNAVGKNDLADLGDQDDRFPNRDRVFTYANRDGPRGPYIIHPSREPMDDAAGQADSDCCDASYDPTPAVSPMLAFADSLAQRLPTYEIGIIPCPLGASGFEPPTQRSWAVSHGQLNRPFGSCLARIEAAEATSEIAGLVIYQGERSARDAFAARVYAARWVAVIQAIRDRLIDPALPVIVIRIPRVRPKADYPHWETVRQQQLKLAMLLQHVVVVDAPDGPFSDPGVNLHLDVDAQLELGPRVTEAFARTGEFEALLQ